MSETERILRAQLHKGIDMESTLKSGLELYLQHEVDEFSFIHGKTVQIEDFIDKLEGAVDPPNTHFMAHFVGRQFGKIYKVTRIGNERRAVLIGLAHGRCCKIAWNFDWRNEGCGI